ncbi:MAG TPA: hypothetical protein VLG47_05310 [Candidatus Saccharimonadales bacterium]|nr:hypothetical protein [Candidatus Saccharimonadales bacterium]
MLESSPFGIPAQVPRSAEPWQLLAPSRPLFELGEIALDESRIEGDRHYDKAPWPVSIDTAANAYAQALLRQGTAEFQKAPNRVAIIFGEGSLHTAINFLPEETIICADISRGACLFMGQYETALRTLPTAKEWLAHMDTVASVSAYETEESYLNTINFYSYIWNKDGYSYAATDEPTYARSHAAAQTKAIIPWRMNLYEASHFTKLAEYLRNLNANVTFVNLTNILGISNETKETYNLVADNLALLPTTQMMPILASSYKIRQALHVRPNLHEGDGLTNRIIFGTDHLRQIGTYRKLSGSDTEDIVA